MKLQRALTLCAALAVLLTANQAGAHGGEDHSNDKPPAGAVSAASAAATEALAQAKRLPDGSVLLPKPLQRQWGVRTERAPLGALAASIELNGKVIADPNSGGRVQAAFAGSVVAGPQGMPLPGRKVRRGEVLASIQPSASAIERGNQKAQLADLEAQLAIAEGRLRRLEQLEGAVPQKEIEAARIEREALQQRRRAVGASLYAAEPLVAPASGVISASHVVAGQMVDAKELLFEIVDPQRLAVEALAYDPGVAAGLATATATTETSHLKLQFLGAGRQLREQALPLLFRVLDGNSLVAVGQPVKVVVRLAHEIRGAAVPRAALVKLGAGEAALWVHGEAERFTLRRVRHQALDAERVAIVEGLQDGERVVVAGAGLLSQVR